MGESHQVQSDPTGFRLRTHWPLLVAIAASVYAVAMFVLAYPSPYTTRICPIRTTYITPDDLLFGCCIVLMFWPLLAFIGIGYWWLRKPKDRWRIIAMVLVTFVAIPAMVLYFGLGMFSDSFTHKDTRAIAY